MNSKRLISLLSILCLLGLVELPDVYAQKRTVRTSMPDKVLEQRAASLTRQGRHAEAVDIYLDLLYRDPANSNLYFRVSSLMPGQENASVLLEIVDDILEKQPNNLRLAAEKGRLLYVLDRKDDANNHWKGLLVEHKKSERFNYATVSNAMLQAGATEEAVQLLEKGRRALGDERAFAFELARIHAVKHNYSQAGREYIRHLDGNSGMLNHISNQLIRMLENDGAYAAIDREFSTFLARPGDHQTILLARAKILLHEKRYQECVQTVLASDVSKETRHVFSIANDLAAEEAWEPAALLYLYISGNSRNKKEVGEALLKLAATYENRLLPVQRYESLAAYFPGNVFLTPDMRFVTEDSRSLDRTLKLYDSLQTLLPQTPEAFQASLHIAEIHLTVSGDIDRAMRGYQQIFERASDRKNKVAAGLRMVDSWLVKGDTSNALQALETLSRRTGLDEDDPKVVTSRIKILMNQGDLIRLKKELLNLSGAALPKDPIFNDGMELIALIEGNGGEEDALLQTYFKAEQKVFQHKLTEAIKLFQAIDGAESTIADDAQVRAIQLLLLLEKHAEADLAMESFLIKFPESEWRASVLVWRGEYLQFERSDPDAAVAYYEDVIINHPGYLEVQKVRQRLRQLLGSGS